MARSDSIRLDQDVSSADDIFLRRTLKTTITDIANPFVFGANGHGEATAGTRLPMLTGTRTGCLTLTLTLTLHGGL